MLTQARAFLRTMLILQRLTHSMGARALHRLPVTQQRCVRVHGMGGRIPKGVELIPDLSSMGGQPGLVGPSGESISGQPSQVRVCLCVRVQTCVLVLQLGARVCEH